MLKAESKIFSSLLSRTPINLCADHKNKAKHKRSDTTNTQTKYSLVSALIIFSFYLLNVFEQTAHILKPLLCIKNQLFFSTYYIGYTTHWNN